MRIGRLVLGFASGAAAGYVAVRTFEAFREAQPARADAKAYGKTRRALAVAGVVRSTAGSIAFAYGPASAKIGSLVSPLPRWMRAGAFATIAGAASALAEFPVEFTEGYRIERRYGLTEQPMRSYIADSVKSTTLEIVVTAALATITDAAIRRFPRSWPVLAAAGALALYALANLIVPVYILPLFNKFQPLDGPLEQRLRALASRFGVGDAEILTMNMSKQTKKANAFVAGIGHTHRIVLGDTLVDHFEPDEIEFVIAHELGHYVSRDTWRLIAAAEATTIVLLAFAAAANARERSDDPVRIARLSALLGTGAQLIRPALAAFSRSREWAADRFAREATGRADWGVAAFERLRDQNLAEDDVPAWYEFFFGTHPGLGKRIAELRA